jgi:predicted membrane-bound mannosyltransferase/DNA-binding beta-propeller fold protein YncE
MEKEKSINTSWLDKPLTDFVPRLTVETVIITLIILLAFVSRLTMLGERVMSHDEVNHVVPSWDLSEGRVYVHDPITHGPLQFHLMALSYFLFGDSDFTSRLPHALFGVAGIIFVIFGFRKYLGRYGSLIAGFLMLISPYMLFYGRYARNDVIIVFFQCLLFLGILKYLESGNKKYLFMISLSMVLQFITKEVAYIHTAQLLIFAAGLFVYELLQGRWRDPQMRKRFVVLSAVLVLLVLMAAGSALWMESELKAARAIARAEQGITDVTADVSIPPGTAALPKIILAGSAAGLLACVALLAIQAVQGLGWKGIRAMRSFDILFLSGSLVLPLLAAVPVKLAGWDPLDYSSQGMLRTGIFALVMLVLSVGSGLWWDGKRWLLHAGLFWAIFTLFYTTFFMNAQGFFTGLVGSLGYWMNQQAVERGSQPWYYYALLQIPVYEYLPALGAIVAFFVALKKNLFSFVASPKSETVGSPDGKTETDPQGPVFTWPRLPVLAMLFFWAVSALAAYSYAGEKMPQMTLYPTLPMILITGWLLGYLAGRVEWKEVLSTRGWITSLLIPVFFAAAVGLLESLLGTSQPFQGNTLEQLKATNQFVFSLLATAGSLAGFIWLVKGWPPARIFSLAGLFIFAGAALLTARTAYTASFINYDTAKEYLTYAHAARGPKDILAQVEEISRRTTGGLNIMVAYDSDALYPYWWYFRDYPNKYLFGENPTRALRDYPIIIASDNLYGKMETVVQGNYTAFEYMRLWWPNQDYYNLTWERIWNAISNPEMRAALFDIWLNRDYTQYAALTGSSTFTLENWQPGDRMRLYIRKDIIAQMWDYGSAPALVEAIQEDPYEANTLRLMPDTVIGSPGSAAGQLSSPRDVAAAPDGSVYVADQLNHRIQHFSETGELLHAWGSFGSTADNTAAPGAFNEPWGVAVGPDGSVYVSDTWNYRIQKFTADGQFIKEWGYSGQGETVASFYGPRGITVDAEGQVFVADTGNKRIVVFTSEGEFITQFGTTGMDLGQLDEPVDIAVDDKGNVYVADTWNQRVQVFAPTPDKLYYPVLTWDISGWYSQSIDNKPFIAVDSANGFVYVTDPEGYRVLQFTLSGEFVRGWGDYSADTSGFGLPVGISVDGSGRVWVSDAGNNRIMRYDLSSFPLPEGIAPAESLDELEE